MNEQQIINKYIEILKEKAEYFKNMDIIYKYINLKAQILVKKIKYRNDKDILDELIKEEEILKEKILKIKNENKIIESKHNINNFINMQFMSLKDNKLLIDDTTIDIIDDYMSEEERNTKVLLKYTYSINKKKVAYLDVEDEDINLKFLLVEENLYNSLDKETLKKYNYILYKGDISRCINNFLKIITLDLKKEKVKIKEYRRKNDTN